MSTSVDELNDHGPFFAAGYRSAWRLPPSSGRIEVLACCLFAKRLQVEACAPVMRSSPVVHSSGSFRLEGRFSSCGTFCLVTLWHFFGRTRYQTRCQFTEFPISPTAQPHVPLTCRYWKFVASSLPKTACGCETRLADDHAAAGIGHCREAVQAKSAIASPSIPNELRRSPCRPKYRCARRRRGPSTLTGTNRLLTNPR